MDYKYRYLNKLKKLISPLNEDVKDEIYYDLIKTEDWLLPNLDELDLYLNELDLKINYMLWKFIYKELTFIHHCSERNERVIRMLKFIKNKGLKIKPFILMKVPSLSQFDRDENYFIHSVKIKKYDRKDHYYIVYNKRPTKLLFNFISL